MCEKEPKRRSCTECPQYDGASCEATGVWLGDKNRVLQDERRHGFICHDTGETEAMIDNIASRLVDATMYHPNSATADCIADMLHKKEGGPFNSVFTGSKMPDGIIHMVDCNPAHAQFQYRPEALPKYAGSPSSECPSRRDGPPQKGKIDKNKAVYNSQRLSVTLSSDDTCYNCKKSHTEGDRLVCDKWGIQNILMPHRLCAKWALDPNKIKRQNEATSLYKEVVSPEPKAGDLVIVPGSSICTADNASLPPGKIIAGSDLQYVGNPPPLFRDLNGFWEPVRPRSCTNCKLYNDPICMKIATHIGTRQEILAKEEENGFICFAADQMQRDE